MMTTTTNNETTICRTLASRIETPDDWVVELLALAMGCAERSEPELNDRLRALKLTDSRTKHLQKMLLAG